MRLALALSQVYACKFLDDSTLLTASDDMVHFWNLETKYVRTRPYTASILNFSALVHPLTSGIAWCTSCPLTYRTKIGQWRFDQLSTGACRDDALQGIRDGLSVRKLLTFHSMALPCF